MRDVWPSLEVIMAVSAGIVWGNSGGAVNDSADEPPAVQRAASLRAAPRDLVNARVTVARRASELS